MITTAVKERPILFSADMVRAILDGRKTQTRRVITSAYKSRRKDGVKLEPSLLQKIGVGAACPYGEPGDMLWVRETWCGHWGPTRNGGKPITDNSVAVPQEDGGFAYPSEDNPLSIYYRADGEKPFPHSTWKPSIHMPRWASRITLEITDVRVERLQEISDDDAMAEGTYDVMSTPHKGKWNGHPAKIAIFDKRMGFAGFWDCINDKRGYGWKENPWVWAITFRLSPQPPAHNPRQAR